MRIQLGVTDGKRKCEVHSARIVLHDSAREQRFSDSALAQWHHPPEPIADSIVVVDTERVQYRCGKILRCVRIVGRICSERIGSAEYATAPGLAARYEQGIARSPMISPRLIDTIAGELSESRRAAEFAHTDNERAFQKPTLVQIF